MASQQDSGVLKRTWQALRTPTARYSVGTLLVGGIVAGVMLWGGFNWSMEMTNNEEFCISCHEMENNVYQEYRGTVHDVNASGVGASCPDCHVPREWTHKVVRKVRATNELFHKMIGTISTPEKFREHRLAMAKSVWTTMKETDSRECRNCHDFESMDLAEQEKRARKRHMDALDQDMTCIECHQGIAHKLPAGALEAADELFTRLDKDGG